MTVFPNISCKLQDRNRNDVVVIDVFREFPMADSGWIVRTTNHIYANQTVKRFFDQDEATKFFADECEKYEKLVKETKSDHLLFRNRFYKDQQDKAKGNWNQQQDDVFVPQD